MKKKLLFVLGLLLVLGLFFAGCSSDDGGSENDPFAGTWIGSGTHHYRKTVAANRAYKVYMNDSEISRGTYTFSGNSVTLKTTEVDSGFLSTGVSSGSRVKYSSLTSAQQIALVQKGISGTSTIYVPDNTITITINMEGATWTKQ